MLRSDSEVYPHGAYLYFLELLGDTTPRYDPFAADVLARRGDPNKTPPAIYEYVWTLGQARTEEGPEDHRDGWARSHLLPARHRVHDTGAGGGGWQFDHHGDFVEVHLLFPRPAHWRVIEFATSLKYLPPSRPQDSVADEAGKDLAHLQPLIGLAGTAVNAAGALGAGPLASATGHVLDAVAKTRINSVPPSKKFPWWIEKTTAWLHTSEAGHAVDGLVWNLPAGLLQVIGTRVSGTIAVSFARVGEPLQPEDDRLLRAYAVLPHPSGPLRVPQNTEKYVHLKLEPRDTTDSQPNSPQQQQAL